MLGQCGTKKALTETDVFLSYGRDGDVQVAGGSKLTGPGRFAEAVGRYGIVRQWLLAPGAVNLPRVDVLLGLCFRHLWNPAHWNRPGHRDAAAAQCDRDGPAEARARQ